ncbi:hypothetical protein CsSME_00001256 [Camellia sinensis var. sinensis]
MNPYILTSSTIKKIILSPPVDYLQKGFKSF